MTTVHDEWLEKIKAYKKMLHEAHGLELQLPPPTIAETGTKFLEIVPGERMSAVFPFQQRFTNPVGSYQGGFLAAAIDDVLGPLSYISAERPCMTLSLNVTFLKTFSSKHKECLIRAHVLQKTKSFIFMRAEVLTTDGELVAHAESHASIMRDEQFKKVNP